MSLLSLFRSFAKNEDGATAIEYGLIAALISVVIIVSLTTIGTEMNNTFYGPIGQTLSSAQTN